MFVLMKSQMSMIMGHVGSKTMSLGQIFEKLCDRSRGHIFSAIIMKLCRNVCLDEISDQFENWSLGQILEKPCVCTLGQIFIPIIMKVGQNVCLDKISNNFENRLCGVKN